MKMKATIWYGSFNDRATKQQDILCEVTNFMFLSLHRRSYPRSKSQSRKGDELSFCCRCNELLHTFKKSFKSLILENTLFLVNTTSPISRNSHNISASTEALASFLLISYPLRFFGKTQLLQPTVRRISPFSFFHKQVPPLVTGSRVQNKMPKSNLPLDLPGCIPGDWIGPMFTQHIRSH